jgi:hypothetical protein
MTATMGLRLFGYNQFISDSIFSLTVIQKVL